MSDVLQDALDKLHPLTDEGYTLKAVEQAAQSVFNREPLSIDDKRISELERELKDLKATALLWALARITIDDAPVLVVADQSGINAQSLRNKAVALGIVERKPRNRKEKVSDAQAPVKK